MPRAKKIKSFEDMMKWARGEILNGIFTGSVENSIYLICDAMSRWGINKGREMDAEDKAKRARKKRAIAE